jgi:hypothetical protein
MIAAVSLLTAAMALLPNHPQPTRYLTPERFTVPAGAPFELRVDVCDGIAQTAAAWPVDDIRWFFVRSHGSQENRDALAAQPAGGGKAVFHASRDGVQMIGLDFKSRKETVSAAALRAFLEKRLLAESLPATHELPENKPVRIRRIESTKLIARTADAVDVPSEVATGKSGQRVEIRPLADPGSVPVGSDLPLRLYADGDKCGNVRVLATHVASGLVRDIAVNAGAFANLAISAAGIWRVEFSKCAPAGTGEAADADWIVWTASLTFETPVAEGGR